MTLTKETAKQMERSHISSKDKCKTFYHLKWNYSVHVARVYQNFENGKLCYNCESKSQIKNCYNKTVHTIYK